MDLHYNNDLLGQTKERDRFRRLLSDASFWFAEGSALDLLDQKEEVPAKSVLAEISTLRSIERSVKRYDDHDTISPENIDAFEAFVRAHLDREAATEKLRKAVKAAAKAGLTYRSMQTAVVRIMDEMLRANPASIPEETDRGWGF